MIKNIKRTREAYIKNNKKLKQENHKRDHVKRQG